MELHSDVPAEVPPDAKPHRAEYGSQSPNGMSKRKKGQLNGRPGLIRSGVYTFVQGRWPRGSQAIKRDGDEYRRILEEMCKRIHGTVDEYMAGVIQTAVTLETSARLWQKWLRDGFDGLSEEAKDRRLQAIGKARMARDHHLRRIGLDTGMASSDEDAWKDLWKKVRDKVGEGPSDGEEA